METNKILSAADEMEAAGRVLIRSGEVLIKDAAKMRKEAQGDAVTVRPAYALPPEHLKRLKEQRLKTMFKRKPTPKL